MDLATLGIEIKNVGVDRATASLDRLSRTAGETERATSRIARGTRAAETATGRMNRQVTAANDNMRRLAQQTDITAVALRSLARVASTIIAALGVQAIVSSADAYTRLSNSLRVAGVSMSNMTDVQNRLFDAANRNGVEIEALGQLYSRASIAAGELGASQGQLLQFVDGVTAALRVQGGSAAASSGALLQLSQALGSGIVRAEEFNSILEGAFPIAQAAARGIEGMGGSVARLRQAIVDGEITSQMFFQGLLQGFTATEAQAAGMALTVEGAFTVLSNSWTRLVGTIDEVFGASAALSGAIAAAGRTMDQAARAVDGFVANLGTIVEAALSVGTVLALVFGRAAMSALATSFGYLVGAVITGLNAIRLAAIANPLGALAFAFTAAVTAAYIFRDEIQQSIGVDVVGIVKNAANLIINSFRAALADIQFVWANLPAIIGNAAVGAANFVISVINNMIAGAKMAVNDLISALNVIPGVALDAIDTSASAIAPIQPITDLTHAYEEHAATIERIMSSDVIGSFAKEISTSFQSGEAATAELNSTLTQTAPALAGVGAAGGAAAKGVSGAGAAASQASQEFEAFQQKADQLAESLFPSAYARQEAEQLFALLDRFGDKLTDLQRQAVDIEIADLFRASELGLRRLEDETAKSGKAMATELQGSLGSVLADLFTGPLKDAEELFDRIATGFAEIGADDVDAMFSNLKEQEQ